MKPKLRWVHGLLLISALATSFSGCGDDGPDDEQGTGGHSGKGPFHSGSGGMSSGGKSSTMGGRGGITPEGGSVGMGASSTGGVGDAGSSGSAGSGNETGVGGTAGAAGAAGASGGDEPGGNGGDGGVGGVARGGSGGTSGGGGGKAGASGGSGKGGGGNGGATGGSGSGGAINKCGNGKIDDGLEQCDRGGAKDGCSASCTLTACDTCRAAQVAGPPSTYLGCSGLSDGYNKACEALMKCVRRTRCADQYIDLDNNPDARPCYCGSMDVDACFDPTTTNEQLQGRCKAEVVVASTITGLPVPAPQEVKSRLYDLALPVGRVFQALQGEQFACRAECTTCSSCRGLQCSVESTNRATRCLGASADKCDAYLACLDSNNCSTNPKGCYCGNVADATCFADAATATTPNGPCRDAAHALAGVTTPKEINRQMGDTTTTLGATHALLTCANTPCQSHCAGSSSGVSGG